MTQDTCEQVHPGLLKISVIWVNQGNRRCSQRGMFTEIASGKEGPYPLLLKWVRTAWECHLWDKESFPSSKTFSRIPEKALVERICAAPRFPGGRDFSPPSLRLMPSIVRSRRVPLPCRRARRVPTPGRSRRPH